MVKYLDRSHVNGSSALPKGSFLYGRWSQLCEAAFTPCGDSTNCNSRVLLLLRAPRHWSGVHYHHRSYGRFRWPFQQATFFRGEKKNIRFTPTKNSNMIFMAHSCGLGGKYQYKHAKVFQIGHLKRLLQCCFNFLSFWLTVSNLLVTQWGKGYFYTRHISHFSYLYRGFCLGNNAPLRAYRNCMCWGVGGFKGLYFPVLSFSAYSSGVL